MSYYQQCYDELRRDGLSEAGALGVLGNFDCESNCEPNRLEGDFSPYRTASKQYTADVESGKISQQQFSGDGKGYGLYQLTWGPRKNGYYSFWKKSGKALDSAELQCDYCVKELKDDYPSLYTFLCTTNDIYEACSRFCREFENPAVHNVDARYQAALRIKNQIDLNPEPVPPEPDPPEPQGDVYWPPRTIDRNCFNWPEVWVLQSILYCRGYGLVPVGHWLDDTTESLIAFQMDNGLVPDGCCGPMTWKKLLEMG